MVLLESGFNNKPKICWYLHPVFCCILLFLLAWRISIVRHYPVHCFLLLQVQLQLLTAIVKLFLKRPTDTQELVQQVLSLATQVIMSTV
jgi:hypothetical protein